MQSCPIASMLYQMFPLVSHLAVCHLWEPECQHRQFQIVAHFPTRVAWLPILTHPCWGWGGFFPPPPQSKCGKGKGPYHVIRSPCFIHMFGCLHSSSKAGNVISHNCSFSARGSPIGSQGRLRAFSGGRSLSRARPVNWLRSICLVPRALCCVPRDTRHHLKEPVRRGCCSAWRERQRPPPRSRVEQSSGSHSCVCVARVLGGDGSLSLFQLVRCVGPEHLHLFS